MKGERSRRTRAWKRSTTARKNRAMKQSICGGGGGGGAAGAARKEGVSCGDKEGGDVVYMCVVIGGGCHGSHRTCVA